MPRRTLIVAGMTFVFVFIGRGAADATAVPGDGALGGPVSGPTLEQVLGELPVSGPCQVGGEE